MIRYIQKTAPEIEPLDIEEVKAHLRVSIDEDDDLIEGFMAAARDRCEKFTQRSLITQDWYAYCDYADIGGACGHLKLRKPPIQALSAFEYLSAANTWTAIDASSYYFDAPGEQIVLNDILPEPYQWHSGYRATFRTGYGDQGDDVPAMIKTALKTIVLHFYENRSAYDASAPDAIPMAGESLLMPYKLMDY